ncbi:hypothetical protein Enr13x_60920 [Stieleria neptunia]|uniref:Uncharacterized protein n=1 Tax=Stieleria neptunia TaxID=2527979 RepID=A0A518HZB0_9BACT|nr:hypothetical protein [Stieleria neptunia]QDV46183.1 hypothetical protein Enr13x_60920 [Stieleria neptunia]
MTTLPARPALRSRASGEFLLHHFLLHCVPLAGLLTSLLAFPFAGSLAAQPPKHILPLPDVPLPRDAQPQDNPAAREALSRALQGDRDAAPLLPADLQELLRTTGSVLDGSSLDPKLAPQKSDALQPPSLSPDQASPGTQSARRRRRAAEMLLKSARLLDKIEPKSENQTYLVNQMHQEAVRLLQDPAGSDHPHQPRPDQRARTSGGLPGDPSPASPNTLRPPPRLTP